MSLDELLLDNARSLAPILKKRASEADRNRRVHPETVRELHEGGFLSMGIPRSLGGTEANLITQLHVYETLGGACASTTWCVGNHNAACRKLHEVMGAKAGPYLRAVIEDGAVISQGIVPTGETRPVQGGFVCDGRWPFLSFSLYARWAILSTTMQGPPPDWQKSEALPTPPTHHNRQLIFGMSDDGLHLEDNWQTMTLRASMSNDLTVKDAFVPEDCAPATPTAMGDLSDTPAAFRLPSNISFSPPCIVLGIAKAAIKETIEFANSTPMSIGGSKRSSSTGNQFAIADAAMLVESAHAFLLRESEAIVAKAEKGLIFTYDDTIRMRMAGQVARENSQQAVERLFVIRGAHGIYESDNFERYYRDVRVGTLPAPSAPDRVREMVGKYLFGM